MIDVIISINDNNTIEDLIDTLFSLRTEEMKVIVIASGKISNEIVKEEIKKLYPIEDIIFMRNKDNDKSHIKNFFIGSNDLNTSNNIVTFLKAGDLFTGIYLVPIIEEIFKNDQTLLTLHTEIENMNNLRLYKNRSINLQGWFFNRGFLDYYNFLNQFENEIEMALHLSYVTDLQPMFHKELNRNCIYINNSLSNIGNSFLNYFNNILPEQVFFNPELGVKYLYDLVCDCYISYIQAINLEIPQENIQSLISDIKTFYDYFKMLELENLEELLNSFNKKMKELYNNENDAFLLKIPDITLITFLENLEKVKE